MLVPVPTLKWIQETPLHHKAYSANGKLAAWWKISDRTPGAVFRYGGKYTSTVTAPRFNFEEWWSCTLTPDSSECKISVVYDNQAHEIPIEMCWTIVSSSFPFVVPPHTAVDISLVSNQFPKGKIGDAVDIWKVSDGTPPGFSAFHGVLVPLGNPLS
jgi:hypothetical protein